jgi:hypothetical protein
MSFTHGFNVAGRMSVSRVATGSNAVGNGLGFGQSDSTVVAGAVEFMSLFFLARVRPASRPGVFYLWMSNY